MPRMTMNASRRASPDLVAISPNRIAPKRNHGVVVANPWKASPKSDDARGPEQVQAHQAADGDVLRSA